ncbi:MAG: IPT/TIG domain-containing protein [Planctomycetes bacterium]|nr:IPT/TIG domain-containing protein [Planctomycetota bacterium]
MKSTWTGFVRVLASAIGLALAISTTALANGSEVEPNDTVFQATHLWCECDVAGAIDSRFDADYFSFSHPTAGPFHAFTTLSSGGDSTIELFQADGTTSVLFDDDDGVGLASHIGIASLPAGDYLIVLRPFSSGDLFPYVLSIRCPGPSTEVEPNDSVSAATEIVCETVSFGGDIGQPGDYDYWSFRVPVTTSVNIVSLQAPAYSDQLLTLLDSSGAVVGTVIDYGGELGASVSMTLTPGVYYYAVSSGTPGMHYDATVSITGRICTVLSSIAPVSGSSSGGDLVYVAGDRFGTVAEVAVQFAGATATVLDSTPTQITARTPAGSVTVDVTVINRGDPRTLPAAYTYRPPEIAARFGNVNAGRGDREIVLIMNAQSGDDAAREMTIGLHQPISIVMTAPSSRVSARFALYVWPLAATPTNLTTLPRGLGNMVLPPPFMMALPHPLAIFNNAGFNQTLGVPTLPSHPAPTQVFSRMRGAPRPATITLQGLIQDNGSQIPEHWSITNAIVVRFQ